MSLFIPLVILPHGTGLSLPAYATPQSAGMDLAAAIDAPRVLGPLARTLIETGLQMALPAGYEAQVRPRSGLAFKEGLTVLNSPGTIDADYRGEIKVLLINLGDRPVMIERGMRIAQLVIAPVTQGSWREVSFFDESLESERKEGGFGSTGL